MNIPTSSSLIPARQRRHRRRRVVAPSAPAVAPVLTAATYEQQGIWVDLSFDQAVDASGLVASQVILDDFDDTFTRYQGVGAATVLSPTSIRVMLDPIGPPQGDLIRLTVGAGNGIVAVDDGAAWAGVNELPLPYP